MNFNAKTIVAAACGIMLAIVFVQAVLPAPAPPSAPPPAPAATCIGTPIPVDYAFAGWNQPHACAVQCEDDRPRFILYSDGKATQCQTPPGCNDEGEDKGILCTPPLTTSAS